MSRRKSRAPVKEEPQDSEDDLQVVTELEPNIKDENVVEASSSASDLDDPAEDAAIKVESDDDDDGHVKEESSSESAQSDVKAEEEDDEDLVQAERAVGKRKAEPLESPKKKEKKRSSSTSTTSSSSSSSTTTTRKKRKSADGDPSKGRKRKKPTKKQKQKKEVPDKKRKKKGDPDDSPSDSSSSSEDDDDDRPRRGQGRMGETVFPLKQVKIGSWVRKEANMRSMRWMLRNVNTRNPEITVEMKGKSNIEAGKKLIFRRLEIDRIKPGKQSEGKERVTITFEISGPPIFERFMPLPGSRGNKWVRTSDYTGGEAQQHRLLKLRTTKKACKKFLELTKKWTAPLLVRSVRHCQPLYFHALNALKPQPEPTTTSSTSTSTTALPSSDDQKAEDSPSLLSLPQEVLMQIIGYMDAKHLLQSVSLVNRAFHNLACDEPLWKKHFRQFCGSLLYSVEEAAWDDLPSRFTSWREAMATTNAMCFFRCTYCGKRAMNSTAGRLLGCIICDHCETRPYCPRLISRTRAEKAFELRDDVLMKAPLRRVTKFNMHGAIVRWYISSEVAAFAKANRKEANPARRLSFKEALAGVKAEEEEQISVIHDEEDEAEEVYPSLDLSQLDDEEGEREDHDIIDLSQMDDEDEDEDDDDDEDEDDHEDANSVVEMDE